LSGKLSGDGEGTPLVPFVRTSLRLIIKSEGGKGMGGGWIREKGVKRCNESARACVLCKIAGYDVIYATNSPLSSSSPPTSATERRELLFNLKQQPPNGAILSLLENGKEERERVEGRERV